MEAVSEALPTTIQDAAEYDRLIAEFIIIFTKHEQRTAAEEARLDVLLPLIKEYEDRTYHFDTPDAVDMILFRMDQMNLKQKDLIPMIGTRPRVSEVLNRKRKLTAKMIKALHEGLNMPYEHLMNQGD